VCWRISPTAARPASCSTIRHGAYNTESLIEFLNDLREHLGGQPVTLIWDGLPAHRSAAMTTWLATQRRWLRVEPPPGYAHDLSPMESRVGQPVSGHAGRTKRRLPH
jgi:transposase